ncbi:osomolarity two-component system, response regulator SSK1 [Capronia epimyces CBS 606.96]|uniref:Osomolarity two-component system, response regulator SSK1 n=1 Tax=Capronia epimyces CBS 606.96 TaxID=1182542 RepID=W9YBC9_9EURO|nr:osomolarity two-component system, response regulator SSK1 [Capronia epimyces CBS 606.96]EXJ79674.1 osomolarity two-component system, response regulator SSK1 [Capronia epimyces CBS 606.96]
MPLSRGRSGPHFPLFRSLSASAANTTSNNPGDTPGDTTTTTTTTTTLTTTSAKATDDDDSPPARSPSGSMGFNLPTLASLANLNIHRRSRAKSGAKRRSLDSRFRRSRSREPQLEPAPIPADTDTPPTHTNIRTQTTTTSYTAKADSVKPLDPSPPNETVAESDPDTPKAPATPPSAILLPPLEPTRSSNPGLSATTEATHLDPPAPVPAATTSPSKAISIRPRAPSPAAGAPSPVSVASDPPLLLLQRPSTPTVHTLPSSLPCSRHGSPEAMQRKIWVKRPGASPTRVEVAEDDLVDNVRDVILRKYANSLGRSIDAPDIILKIVSREQSNKIVTTERVLGPEEPIGATLDAYYPGGQKHDEALVIEVPPRRTPRPSPRSGNHQISYIYQDQYRPDDAAREYFPPMPLHSPHLAQVQHNGVPHAMTVLTTGQLPPLPSPGSHGQRRHGRPKYGRQHTSSPTILHTVQPNGQVIESKSQMNGTVPSAPPLPTPPAAQGSNEHSSSITPPNRVSSPHPGQKSKKRRSAFAGRGTGGDPPSSSQPAAAALLDGTVPPINVLIVEDNVINLKLLEAFMKRLKVRWKSAMNGKEAVAMWRTGGFHLVLMDIQLPVMNGLEATKEIRRLEAVNGIGVFGGSPIDAGAKMAAKNGGPVGEADALPDRSLFKSPVIIVALTASSLQSDRHEALAAGCNDFLTKPVNFVWMERKVTEWGCMQALIDFDGWRKWKQYADEKAQEDPAKKAAEEKEEKAKTKAALKAMFSRPPPGVKKDSGGSTGSSTSTERTPTPVRNGSAKKSASPSPTGGSSRNPKLTRSNPGSGGGGSGGLESMAEEDEKGS